MTSGVVCYIGIGANLGDAGDQVRSALLRLGELPQSRLTGQSDLFRTAPVEAGGDDYINAVAQLDTHLGAEDLLRALQAIEQDFGRERPYRNAPRTLDLDVLLYGQQRIASSMLEVPHPRMTERAFVLIPLLQIDPFISIPGKGPAHSFVGAVAGQVIRRI
jgi:2-amino-4-hydroxy-6-hydroxymethyldihydropteridine diphosphokinase